MSEKKAILLAVVLCLMIAAGLWGMATWIDLAGAEEIPATGVGLYFQDVDGTRMDIKQMQKMLIAKDYRDNDGNKIVADGKCGTRTWQAASKYICDQNAAETYRAASILEVAR